MSTFLKVTADDNMAAATIYNKYHATSQHFFLFFRRAHLKKVLLLKMSLTELIIKN